jgi:hypothetical protein
MIPCIHTLCCVYRMDQRLVKLDKAVAQAKTPLKQEQKAPSQPQAPPAHRGPA